MSEVRAEHRIARLRALVAEYPNGAAELGRLAGWKDGSYIGQMLRGTRPITEEVIDKFESLPGRKAWFHADPTYGPWATSLENLSAQEESGMFPYAIGEPLPGYIKLPVMGEAAAGPGRDPESFELVQEVEVLESWIRQTMRVNPRLLRVLTARGQSMHGVVEDGDVLFVLPCSEFKDDGLYVITVEGLLRVKRLRLRIADRQLSIESTDGSTPDVVPLSSVGESVLVQGFVVGAWGFKKL